MFSCCKPLLTPSSASKEEQKQKRKDVALATQTTPGTSPSTSPSLTSEMLRSMSENRILQPVPPSATSDRRSSTQAPPRSLFEAAAIRVASHRWSNTGAEAGGEVDDCGLPKKFLDAYIAALRDANPRWATESTLVGDMFTSDCKMVTQDKQTFVGKSNVLRRLDNGT